MISNIKKGIVVLGIPLALLAIQGCSSKNEKQTAAANEAAPAKESHGEEETAIATLSAEQIKEVGVVLGNIEYKQLDATISANGVLRVPNDSKGNATSLYGGVVKTLKVQVGDYVSKGQTIATIANPQFVQLQEEYLTIDSRIVLAEQEQQRQQELNAGNAGAKKNLQSATAELSTLRTRKASLKQQLELMGISPASISNSSLQAALPVKSPISGTVSNVMAKIGGYVDGATPIMEIINNSSLHLDLQVFERDLPKMKMGQIVHFNLTNNPATEYDAKIFSVGSSFENESKTIAVHAKVLGNQKGLIDGMNITGIVSLNNVNTAAVPNAAIVEAEGKYFVFIQSDKKADTPAETDEHGHGKEEGQAEAVPHAEEKAGTMNFEKVEVVKGVSNMGYTGITFVKDVPKGAKVVIKGAFFVNAKLSNSGGHEH